MVADPSINYLRLSKINRRCWEVLKCYCTSNISESRELNVYIVHKLNPYSLVFNVSTGIRKILFIL